MITLLVYINLSKKKINKILDIFIEELERETIRKSAKKWACRYVKLL